MASIEDYDNDILSQLVGALSDIFSPVVDTAERVAFGPSEPSGNELIEQLRQSGVWSRAIMGGAGSQQAPEAATDDFIRAALMPGSTPMLDNAPFEASNEYQGQAAPEDVFRAIGNEITRGGDLGAPGFSRSSISPEQLEKNLVGDGKGISKTIRELEIALMDEREPLKRAAIEEKIQNLKTQDLLVQEEATAKANEEALEKTIAQAKISPAPEYMEGIISAFAQQTGASEEEVEKRLGVEMPKMNEGVRLEHSLFNVLTPFAPKQYREAENVESLTRFRQTINSILSGNLENARQLKPQEITEVIRHLLSKKGASENDLDLIIGQLG